MEGYFWMNIDGAIFNVGVRRFFLYRGTRPMTLLRDMALETGAVDEILIRWNAFKEKPGPGQRKIYGRRGSLTDEFGQSDPLNVRKFPEAFLTVNKRKGGRVKYRLTGVSILAYHSGLEPYGHPAQEDLDDMSMLLSFDKVERAAHAPSSPPR